MNHPEELYTGTSYLKHNPTWDCEDAPWKARKVVDLLLSAGVEPGSICEVGCGAGGVLAELRAYYPASHLSGYDISPHAEPFWRQHSDSGIEFHVGDFLSVNRCFDTILLLDVLEHIVDPYTFLNGIKQKAKQFVFHFPLDLSAISVLREAPLLLVRRRVGHIHYFTKGLALELLGECGFEILAIQYTGAAFETPKASWKTRLAQIPRRLAYALNKDWGVRLLGGETLMVFATPR